MKTAVSEIMDKIKQIDYFSFQHIEEKVSLRAQINELEKRLELQKIQTDKNLNMLIEICLRLGITITRAESKRIIFGGGLMPQIDKYVTKHESYRKALELIASPAASKECTDCDYYKEKYCAGDCWLAVQNVAELALGEQQ